MTYGALAFLLLIVGLFTLLHTPWFKRYARDFVVRQSHSILEGDLSIGQLDGDFFSGLVLNDVVIRQAASTSAHFSRNGRPQASHAAPSIFVRSNSTKQT